MTTEAHQSRLSYPVEGVSPLVRRVRLDLWPDPPVTFRAGSPSRVACLPPAATPVAGAAVAARITPVAEPVVQDRAPSTLLGRRVETLNTSLNGPEGLSVLAPPRITRSVAAPKGSASRWDRPHLKELHEDPRCQSATPLSATTLSIDTRTRRIPGTLLRAPYSGARSVPT